MGDDENVRRYRIDIGTESRTRPQDVHHRVLQLLLDEVGVGQRLGAAARGHSQRLPPRDELGPGQLGRTVVQLLRVGRRELAHRLEHAQRGAQLQARPQRNLAFAGKPHQATSGADAFCSDAPQLSFESLFRAPRTSRVTGLEHDLRIITG